MTLCGSEAGPWRRGLDRAAFAAIVLAPVVVAIGIALGAIDPPWRTADRGPASAGGACAVARAADKVGR